MKRRVVVTGLGLVTPCGNDVPTTWAAMMNGDNGADYIKKFDTEKFPVKFACEVKDFDPLSFLDKKEARRMGAFTHFALAASDEAMKDSGLALDEKKMVYISRLNEEAGYAAADMILKMKVKPDGVFSANDTSAVYCMMKLKEAGLRIPADIAFAGFNNDPISKIIEPNPCKCRD